MQKISFDVGMNGDDALTKLQPGEYFNALNFRAGTSERGHISGLQTLPGTSLLYNTLPAGQNYCIGGCEDEGKSQLFWFNYNSNGNHGIYYFDQVAGVAGPVLLNSQVTGGFGWALFTYIHSCFLVNRNIYWTDNVMPRRFNVDAAINMNNGVTPPVIGTFDDTVTVGNTQTVGGSGLTSVFSLTPDTVSYGPGVGIQLIRNGAIGATTFNVPVNWSAFPGTPYQTIIFNAIQAFLSSLAASGPGTWTLGIVGTTITMFTAEGWDMGTGDFSVPSSVVLVLFTAQHVLSQSPYVYTSPLSQAVISWIRKPPAFPPSQAKILESPVPSANLIGDDAFQFAWRYVFQGAEQSTLSPLSSTADFNAEDPPPIENKLPFSNTSSVLRGYLATNMLLPTSAAATAAGVPYGPGMFAKITRVGTGGPNATATDIDIPLDWSVFPAKNYNYVIVKGLAVYFAALPGSDNTGALTGSDPPQSAGFTTAKWYISSQDGVHPTLNILETWDWGMGDALFPPTASAQLTLYTQTAPASRQFSRIDITLPFTEQVDQDVKQVDLVAAFLVSGEYFIIKSWRKSIAAEAVAIGMHNAGVTALAYSFRNNQAGIALDSPYSVKQNDAVPITAGTVALARNKGFMGNIASGYDSQNLTTSLSLTQVATVFPTPSSTVVQGEWYAIRYISLPSLITTVYVIRTSEPVGNQPISGPYYYYTVAGAKLPLPVSVTTGLLFIGNDLPSVMNYLNSRVFIDQTDQGISVALTPEVPNASFALKSKCLKSNSFYQATVTFYDTYQRHGGTITNDGLRVTIPNTGFDKNSFITALNWSLSNTNAINEIPDSAVFYSIGITKCLRTRFFEQAVGFASYCAINASGDLSFTTYLYAPNLHGVAIDISFLVSNGMGYTFNQGDICNLFINGVYYSLGVIGTDGNYLICALRDIGTLGSSALAKYEIYTPYKQQSNEPSFEQGQLYAVNSPGTAGRAYSVLSGSIGGDTFLFSRSNGGINYVAEAMSPNNKHYLQWITNAGRPNFADFLGQVNKTMSVAFSNGFVQGSQVNGLSTFDATDTVDLSQEFGDLQKLILASKEQKEGSIMLAICIRETVSLYLSETQVTAPQGNAFLAVSPSVIGTVYPLQKGLGTINPESVVLFRGNIYWVDVNNGGPVMYSDNGLELITKKMHTFWRKWCATYKPLSQTAIAAFGSRPFIVGGVDPFNEEILFTLPQILATNPNGTLPGYSSSAPQNLFDCFDGMAKTMIFKIKKDYWNPPVQATGEQYLALGNLLYGFKNGALWLHNDTNAPANSLYGTVYPSMVMFAANELPNAPKKFIFVNVEADDTPGWLICMTDYPNVQITDIEGEEWNNKEGVFYRSLLRDRLSPAFSDFNKALLYGDKIVTKAPMFQLIFGITGAGAAVSVGQAHLKYVNVGYEVSKGHKTIPA